MRIPYRTIIDATWKCAQKGLSELTPENIGTEANIDVATVRDIFPTQKDILLALIQNIQDQSQGLPHLTTPREALFDLTMARFDVMQAHRPAVEALYDDLCDPRHALLLLQLKDHFIQHAETLLSQAQVDISGITGWGKPYAYGLFCLWLMRTWRYDTSTDLSKTMAALDQGLDQMDVLNQTLYGFWGASR